LTGDTGLDLETKGLLLSASLECDLDRFTEKTLARFTIDGVSGVLASARVRWLEGVLGFDIEVKSQLYHHVSTTRWSVSVTRDYQIKGITCLITCQSNLHPRNLKLGGDEQDMTAALDMLTGRRSILANVT
jgi:hypothetical protein